MLTRAALYPERYVKELLAVTMQLARACLLGLFAQRLCCSALTDLFGYARTSRRAWRKNLLRNQAPPSRIVTALPLATGRISSSLPPFPSVQVGSQQREILELWRGLSEGACPRATCDRSENKVHNPKGPLLSGTLLTPIDPPPGGVGGGTLKAFELSAQCCPETVRGYAG